MLTLQRVPREKVRADHASSTARRTSIPELLGATIRHGSADDTSTATGVLGGGVLYLAQAGAEGTLEIRGSTITGNYAKGHGGGIFAGGFGATAQEGFDDGVLYIPGGTIDIVNCVIDKNSAGETGGGIRTDWLDTGAREVDENNSADSHIWNTKISVQRPCREREHHGQSQVRGSLVG